MRTDGFPPRRCQRRGHIPLRRYAAHRFPSFSPPLPSTRLANPPCPSVCLSHGTRETRRLSPPLTPPPRFRSTTRVPTSCPPFTFLPVCGTLPASYIGPYTTKTVLSTPLAGIYSCGGGGEGFASLRPGLSGFVLRGTFLDRNKAGAKVRWWCTPGGKRGVDVMLMLGSKARLVHRADVTCGSVEIRTVALYTAYVSGWVPDIAGTAAPGGAIFNTGDDANRRRKGV